jgi:hypothetical protein
MNQAPLGLFEFEPTLVGLKMLPSASSYALVNLFSIAVA